MYRIVSFALVFLSLCVSAVGQDPYFPSGNEWERKDPAGAGFVARKLNDAILFARQNESSAPRDQELGLSTN